MYLSTLSRVLLRRWPLVVVALMLALAGAYAVAARVGPEYRTSASVVLVPPHDIEEPATNRYLDLGSLEQAVGVLVRSLDAEAVHDAVADRADGGTYSVEADYTTSAPILVVSASGETPSAARRTLRVALGQVPAALQVLQTAVGTDQDQLITDLRLTDDVAPARVVKPMIRALVGAGGVLVCLLLGLVVLLDGVLLRRRARRGATDEQRPDVEGDDPAAAPVGAVQTPADEPTADEPTADETDPEEVTAEEVTEEEVTEEEVTSHEPAPGGAPAPTLVKVRTLRPRRADARTSGDEVGLDRPARARA